MGGPWQPIDTIANSREGVGNLWAVLTTRGKRVAGIGTHWKVLRGILIVTGCVWNVVQLSGTLFGDLGMRMTALGRLWKVSEALGRS